MRGQGQGGVDACSRSVHACVGDGEVVPHACRQAGMQAGMREAGVRAVAAVLTCCWGSRSWDAPTQRDPPLIACFHARMPVAQDVAAAQLHQSQPDLKVAAWSAEASDFPM